jgi:hypothetical protein
MRDGQLSLRAFQGEPSDLLDRPSDAFLPALRFTVSWKAVLHPGCFTGHLRVNPGLSLK